MVLLSIFFLHESDHGGIVMIVLYSLSLHALALHLAVKILLQIFLCEDLSTLALHTSLSVVFPQNASRIAQCAILLSENVPNI